MKLTKGDKVIVISGKDKGKTGTVQKVLPKENKVVVDGINIQKRNKKPTQANPEGSIVEIYAPLDASKVAYYDEKGKVQSKIGYKLNKDGKKVRFLKKTNKEIK